MLRLATADGESVRAPLSKPQAIALLSRVRSGLSLNARTILGFIASRCDAPDEDGMMRRSRTLPRAWLAECIEKSERVACRAVRELLDAGLVERTVTGREAFYAVRLGVAEALVAGELREAAGGRKRPPREDENVLSSVPPLRGGTSPDPASSAGPGPAEVETPSGEEPSMPTDPVALRKAVKSFSGEDPKPRRKAKEPDAGLTQAYLAARRDFDPLYRGSRSDASRLLRAEEGLRLRRIPPERWPEYVRWCFERFAEIKHEPTALPASLLHSDWFLDNYAAAMPRRKIDAKKARALLRSRPGGYDGMVSAAVEIAVALYSGLPPPDYGVVSREAGEWLASRLDEIGTVEVEE